MKTGVYGRIMFGASAALFGAIALMWHDAETWQSLSWIWRLPMGSAIGGCFLMAQIAGGLGIQFRRSVRWAAMVLGAVYLLFALACIPGIVTAPGSYEHYPSFFEQFCLLCGAMALFAATEASETRAAALRRAARLGLGICTMSFAMTQMVYLRATASMVPKWIPPGQMFWAVATTIAFAAAAIAILIDHRARLALRLTTLMLALFGALVWIPRLMAHPEAHSNWSEFALTVLITGACWVAADTSAPDPAMGRGIRPVQ